MSLLLTLAAPCTAAVPPARPPLKAPGPGPNLFYEKTFSPTQSLEVIQTEVPYEPPAEPEMRFKVTVPDHVYRYDFHLVSPLGTRTLWTFEYPWQRDGLFLHIFDASYNTKGELIVVWKLCWHERNDEGSVEVSIIRPGVKDVRSTLPGFGSNDTPLCGEGGLSLLPKSYLDDMEDKKIASLNFVGASIEGSLAQNNLRVTVQSHVGTVAGHVINEDYALHFVYRDGKFVGIPPPPKSGAKPR